MSVQAGAQVGDEFGGAASGALAQRVVQRGGVGPWAGLGAGPGEGQQPAVDVGAAGEVGDDVAAAPAGQRRRLTGPEVGQRVEGGDEACGGTADAGEGEFGLGRGDGDGVGHGPVLYDPSVRRSPTAAMPSAMAQLAHVAEAGGELRGLCGTRGAARARAVRAGPLKAPVLLPSNRTAVRPQGTAS
ncbi:hypothetical protein UK12_19960 [Saccharothrix sp. ST-888]|nr:hypothetical protein UK12_19960 [Saccharothrix sp. ST-888]